MIDHQILKLVSKGVADTLNKSVRGHVNVKVISNTMYVDITPNDSLAFRYTYEQVFDKVIQGVTSQTIADECLKSYSRYINCQFFKQKSVDKC